jgi:stage II sporulation protein D
LSAPHRFIRIAVRQNINKVEFFSAGRVDIISAGADRVSARGDLTIESGSAEKVLCRIPQIGSKEFALPCTLRCANEFNIIECNGTGYRGSIALIAEDKGRFSAINYCNVEDYLRGVVPLEIGNGGADEIEAIKAQAIAARTYTYKKIIERQKQPFDLLPTIADQVYGGAGVEKPLCNQAIRETADLVATFADTLIYAYYHSTCGGKTANVEDVWDKPPLPYLRSVNDKNDRGEAFCAQSPNFTWEESWSPSQLSSIIGRFSKEAFPQNAIAGRLTELRVESRYACGRCRSCKVTTVNGDVSYGGDKIRFVLRRNVSGFPILRSAVITGVSMSGGSVHCSGKGYGHGVGMCQYGAIGRALAGQTYEQIIKAYYTGVEIRSIGAR